MTSKTWGKRRCIPHGDDWYIGPNDGSEVFCQAFCEEDAAQIAHEHNTHAALVEALGVARDAILQLSQVLGMGTIAAEAIDKADAALAAAKGGPK